MSDVFRIRIEQLENGYTVEVPDIAEMKAKKAAADKAKAKDPMACSPYMGDCTQVFAAKTVKEVLKLVETSLKDLPEAAYDTAFEEAVAGEKD